MRNKLPTRPLRRGFYVRVVRQRRQGQAVNFKRQIGKGEPFIKSFVIGGVLCIWKEQL